MKIWLDDLRPAPWGYESARSVNEAKTLIREAERNGIEIGRASCRERVCHRV